MMRLPITFVLALFILVGAAVGPVVAQAPAPWQQVQGKAYVDPPR